MEESFPMRRIMRSLRSGALFLEHLIGLNLNLTTQKTDQLQRKAALRLYGWS